MRMCMNASRAPCSHSLSVCVCMLLIYAFLLIRGGSRIAGTAIEFENQKRKNGRKIAHISNDIEHSRTLAHTLTHSFIHSFSTQTSMNNKERSLLTLTHINDGIYVCDLYLNRAHTHTLAAARRFRLPTYTHSSEIHGYSSCLF